MHLSSAGSVPWVCCPEPSLRMTRIMRLRLALPYRRGMDAQMLRRWWRDHGDIDRALDEVRLELDRDGDGTARQVDGLVAALERHFQTEEEVYFPLARGRFVESAALLERARWGHGKIRQELAELRALTNREEWSVARRVFAALVQGLQVHEEEEVAILVELERIMSARPPKSQDHARTV